MSIVINMVGGKGGSGSGLPNFTYTGTYKVAQDGGKWEIALLTSGTFTASKNFSCDVFMVGGGYGGATSSDAYWGGAGGRGGNRLTKRGLTLTAGAHTITIGGSGNQSSLDGYTTTDTGYEQGGAGGRRCELDNTGTGWYVNVSSSGGDAGQKAFNGEDCLSTSDFYGYYFAPGGGGGGASYGGAYDNGSSGGTTGGGSGGQTNKNGTANTGGGGGGSYGTQYAAGSGGSGIIIIRGGK